MKTKTLVLLWLLGAAAGSALGPLPALADVPAKT